MIQVCLPLLGPHCAGKSDVVHFQRLLFKPKIEQLFLYIIVKRFSYILFEQIFQN